MRRGWPEGMRPSTIQGGARGRRLREWSASRCLHHLRELMDRATGIGPAHSDILTEAVLKHTRSDLVRRQVLAAVSRPLVVPICICSLRWHVTTTKTSSLSAFAQQASVGAQPGTR